MPNGATPPAVWVREVVGSSPTDRSAPSGGTGNYRLLLLVSGWEGVSEEWRDAVGLGSSVYV